MRDNIGEAVDSSRARILPHLVQSTQNVVSKGRSEDVYPGGSSRKHDDCIDTGNATACVSTWMLIQQQKVRKTTPDALEYRS